MIQVTPHMRVLVAVEPADFRKGIDGMAQLCRSALGEDPFSGTLFVFSNRRRTAIKVLVYDGRGFWLCHRRLSTGRLRWWPSTSDPHAGAASVEAHQLMVLICGGDPDATGAVPPWRSVAPVAPLQQAA